MLVVTELYLSGAGSIFPGSLDGRASDYNVGDLGLILRSGRSPGEGNGNPLQYSCLENPVDGGAYMVCSLVGYRPWGHKESDMTEQLHWFNHPREIQAE